jgi:2-iminobutanoate/2-iminopropanoate deaminase
VRRRYHCNETTNPPAENCYIQSGEHRHTRRTQSRRTPELIGWTSGFPRVEADHDRYLESSAVQLCPRSERLVFVLAQASAGAAGAIIPGTFNEEISRSMVNVESVLASASLSLRDVLRATSSGYDSADGPRYNEIYRYCFTVPLPARTTISNCLSPAVKLEIGVIGIRPNQRTQISVASMRPRMYPYANRRPSIV